MFRKFQSSLSAITLASLLVSFAITGKENIHAGPAAEFQGPGVSGPQQIARNASAKRPLLFEANLGQTDASVRFVSRTPGYTVYLTETEAVFSLGSQNAAGKANSPDALKMKFAGASEHTVVDGADEAITKSNYYIDEKRFEDVPNYKQVSYKGLYDGIDAVFYGNKNDQLEYDFNVGPYADAGQIRLQFDGAENVSVDESGNLIVKTANNELVQQRPFAYQQIDGEKREVASSYFLIDERTVGFKTGEFDHSRTLVIDPIFANMSYLSGDETDEANAVTVDAAGNVYVTGGTSSLDFPNAPQNGSVAFVYVIKLSPDGRTVLYNSFISVIFAAANDIAVDAAGNAYIGGDGFGITPTPGVVQSTFPDRVRGFLTCISPIGFVTKLNANGTLNFTTLLGGNCADSVLGLALHTDGRIYVTGTTVSNNFPLKNEYQGNSTLTRDSNAFLTVLNNNATAFVYSTILKGRDDDVATDVALDSSGNAYVTGRTASGNFPTRGGFDDESGGGTDAFVAKINPNSAGDASLVYSTFIGGSGTDIGNAIASTPEGVVFITGTTGSFNFPLLRASDSVNQVNEAYVTSLNPNGTLRGSTFVGGDGIDEGRGISLDASETIYVTGRTSSTDFLLKEPIQSTRIGTQDAFVVKMRLGFGGATFSTSLSTYVGGLGSSSCNSIVPRGTLDMWVVCSTSSSNLPVTTGALDTTPGGDGKDGFIFRLSEKNADTIGVFDPTAGVFNLRNSLTAGAPDTVVTRGGPADAPVAGDFNGDGIDTVSTFNNGVWKIRNTNSTSFGNILPTITVNFGTAGDLPVVGDWNGDGLDTVGVFRPGTGEFLLTNSLAANPPAARTFRFGQNGDLPVAGDWNGDGLDTVGVLSPSGGQTFFSLTNSETGLTIDITSFFGLVGDLPFAGDFDGDSIDSIGVWRPSSQQFFLSNDNLNISDQIVFGQANNTPVIGDWDGKP